MSENKGEPGVDGAAGLRTESRVYAHILKFVLFFIAASAALMGFYVKWMGRMNDPRSDQSLYSMIDGNAMRPFAYRRLVPDLTNWITNQLPQGFKDAHVQHIRFVFSTISDSVQIVPGYEYKFILVYCATFAFALLAVYAMSRLCSAMGTSPAIALITPIIFILLIPYFQSMGGFFYDYSELAFFAIAFLFALRYHWLWLIPIAMLGTWNKESFLIFIPTLYPLIRQRASRTSSVIGVASLCMLSAAIYEVARIRFAHNAGAPVIGMLKLHILELMSPRYQIYSSESTYGVIVPKIGTILPFAFIVWTLWRGWKHLPKVVKIHALIAAAINIPFYWLFGFPGELRNLSLLYLTLLLALAANLSEMLNGKNSFIAGDQRERSASSHV